MFMRFCLILVLDWFGEKAKVAQILRFSLGNQKLSVRNQNLSFKIIAQTMALP